MENEKQSKVSIFETKPPKIIISANIKEASNSKEKEHQTRKWPQYYSAFAAQIGAFALGATWFWSSTGIPAMGKSGDFGNLTTLQRSWITSTHVLGGVLVGPVAGYCLATFGRKKTLLWSCIPFAIAWFLVAFSNSLPIIYVGRVIAGACGGLSGQIGPLFIAETVEPDIRGMLLCMFELMIGVGTLFIYIVGAYTPWRVQAMVCGVIPIFGFVSLYFVPESPFYLIERGEGKKAAQALCWFRGTSSNTKIVNELAEITNCIEGRAAVKDNLGWRALTDPSVLKPILISMALMTFFHTSYVNVILASAVEIFQSAGSYDYFDEYLSTILIGLTQVVATIIPMVIADKLDRRILLMLSLGWIACSLTCLGFYFHFKEILSEREMQEWNWVPLAALIVHVIACSVGIVPLAWVISVEITPPKAKGLATAIVVISQRILGFFIMFTFRDTMNLLGKDGTYWLISAVNVFAAVFTFLFVPPTNGKSLEEIQMYFAQSEITQL